MLTPIDQNEEKILLKLRELPEDKRAEVLDFLDFLRFRIISRRQEEGQEYSYYLAILRQKIRDRGGLELGKTREERIQKLRDTRDSVWKDNYENRFGHQRVYLWSGHGEWRSRSWKSAGCDKDTHRRG